MLQAELVSLMKLNGMNALRARRLFDAGLTTPARVATAGVDQVTKVLLVRSRWWHFTPAVI